jgi:hypothetical protein
METLLNITALIFFVTLFVAISLGAIALTWLMIDCFKDFRKERRS